MTDQPYPQPLERLLTLGDPLDDWPDYPAQYGLSVEHIPDLIRMAEDNSRWDEEDDENPRVYANIHAWRALGQLGAVEATPHLLKLCAWVDEYGDDWASEELSRVFGMLGVAAIPAISRYIADQKNGMWARSVACDGLVMIAKSNPDSAPMCAEILAGVLADYAHNDPVLNGSIVISLAHLRQPATYAIVEEAFKAGQVDLTLMGDWEEFQVEVGLLEKRITEPKYPWLPPVSGEMGGNFIRPARQTTAAKKEKDKRKQEKQSRKQNRKKKKK
jgi:hypothetical protein